MVIFYAINSYFGTVFACKQARSYLRGLPMLLRFSTALIITLMLFAACSRSGGPVAPDVNPDEPDSAGYGMAVESDSQGVNDVTLGGMDVWAAMQISWNPGTGELEVTNREGDLALRHFRVSYFLTPPWCDDCIDIVLTDNDPELGTGSFDVTLKNPTTLYGYDVRGMLQLSSGTDLRLLNADGYSTLFENPEYQYPAPFITFAGFLSDHAFSPGSSFTEEFDLKTAPGTVPVNFNFLVTAGHPSPAGDVSSIHGFRQTGQLLPSGGNALVSIDIKDLQDDIGGVCLRTGVLGMDDVWLMPSNGRWEAWVTNYGAAPGIHELKVDAYSPNFQNAVTSHYYRAVVFHDYGSYRTELLGLVNVDRAANGLGALSLNDELNTVAQSHAQDMADREYFSHVNLDGWTPWQRMDYYGVEFGSAGENIAVGHDTPTDVEVAWMDSTGHRANILGTSFNEIGIGIVPIESGDSYYPGYYWVQVFTD